MTATPHMLYSLIESALSAAPTGWRHRRTPVLVVRAPRIPILGHNFQGRRMVEADGEVYHGYTRRQCVQMKRLIEEAARHDAPLEDPEAPQ